MNQNHSGPPPTQTMPGHGSPGVPPTATMGQQKTQTMNREAETQRIHVSLGTIISGYTLTGVIAENTGEAAIFLCDKVGKNFVAKVYHANKKPKDEILNIIRSINNPQIISILENGEYEGRYFEILPFYQQGDLQKEAPLTAEFIIHTLVPEINEALHALHGKGIVHRDIKPNNVYFTDDRQHIVVGDFGISSILAGDMSIRLTSLSRTLGYSAPETTQGFVSRESDYYSLGISLLFLATGVDPFAGMEDTQIIMQTLNYKLNIPADVHPRITSLIRGLTVKERKDRWGYEELKRWINNETVEIKESIRRKSDVKPYVFDSREIFTLDDLALSLAVRWEEGIKHLYRGFITDHLKQFGQDLASNAMDFQEEKNRDIGLFKLIYAINGDAPLCWHGEMFFDMGKLAEAMKKSLPDVNENYLLLLTSGALRYFLEKKGYDRELIWEVRILEVLADTDTQMAYYKLTFLLGNSTVLSFRKTQFNSVDDLAKFLYDNRQDVEKISEELLESKYFFAWMEHLGFSKQIEAWRKIEY